MSSLHNCDGNRRLGISDYCYADSLAAESISAASPRKRLSLVRVVAAIGRHSHDSHPLLQADSGEPDERKHSYRGRRQSPFRTMSSSPGVSAAVRSRSRGGGREREPASSQNGEVFPVHLTRTMRGDLYKRSVCQGRECHIPHTDLQEGGEASNMSRVCDSGALAAAASHASRWKCSAAAGSGPRRDSQASVEAHLTVVRWGVGVCVGGALQVPAGTEVHLHIACCLTCLMSARAASTSNFSHASHRFEIEMPDMQAVGEARMFGWPSSTDLWEDQTGAP